jgi:hypothetical protein
MSKPTRSLPRGLRNHNPGNIERTETNWAGMATDQSGDQRFVVFRAPEWGLRAIARIVHTYRRRYGLDTVAGIIGRWAPPKENDTESYIAQVAKALGVAADQRLDLSREDVMADLVEAIVQHENGQQPYSREMILKGVRLA